jgi:hypothetical protein
MINGKSPPANAIPVAETVVFADLRDAREATQVLYSRVDAGTPSSNVDQVCNHLQAFQ